MDCSYNCDLRVDTFIGSEKGKGGTPNHHGVVDNTFSGDHTFFPFFFFFLLLCCKEEEKNVSWSGRSSYVVEG